MNFCVYRSASKTNPIFKIMADGWLGVIPDTRIPKGVLQ